MRIPKNDLLFIVAAFVIWRLLLQVVALTADQWLSYQPSFPFVEQLESTQLPRSTYSWSNFDGIHYHTIAKQGYVGFGLIQAFFPAYPVLIRLFMTAGIPLVQSSLIIAHVATFLTLIALYLVSREVWNRKVARWSILTFLIFPVSFFMIAGYTESMFLALLFWSFWLLQKRRWVWAALLAGVASGTKIVGVLWSAVVVIEYLNWYSFKIRRSIVYILILGLISISGFLAYSYYLHQEFNDFLFYLHVQDQFGAGRSDSFVLLPQVFWRATKILVTARPFDLRYYTYVLEFVSAAWTLASLVIAWKVRVPKSLIVFSLLAFLVPTLTGTFSSLPRYLLTVPTTFLVLGPVFSNLYKRSSSLALLLLVILSLLLVLNTALFIQGHWIS